MLAFIQQIADWFFNQVGLMWVVYTTAPIISSFFALWVLDRIFHIFNILKS